MDQNNLEVIKNLHFINENAIHVQNYSSEANFHTIQYPKQKD